MITYVALLRGINVSGQKIIKMVDLKETFQRLGFENVQTYIQSGNVIFGSDNTHQKELVRIIESAIFLDYNFDVPVLVIPVLKMKKIVARNPFKQKGITELKKLHVTFLEKEPGEDLINEISTDPNSEDEFHVAGKTVYLHCPNGYGKTKLNNNYFESTLKMRATTRNWKSVEKIVELSR